MKILHEKPILQEKLLLKKRSFFNIKQKKSKIFFETFQKQNDNFLRDPKKKIDKRKSRKVISKNATNQKNMEHTRQRHDARRKKQDIYHG